MKDNKYVRRLILIVATLFYPVLYLLENFHLCRELGFIKGTKMAWKENNPKEYLITFAQLW